MDGKIVSLKKLQQKYDSYKVYVGSLDDKGQFVEENQVGVGFLRGDSKVFSLRLWIFDSQKYYVAPNDDDSTKYEVLSLEEYTTRDGENRSLWRLVGRGEYFGNYVRLKFFLLESEIYLSLFPTSLGKKSDEKNDAA